ncbi:diaminopimelate epimerase [Campylobacter sp. RM5004]|uniref:diaminopimelate epimerase n=1 Tax=Campylobacter sp. RM5004 TaxID=1660078 RepID=UPI001EFA4EB2|nr:diaminopimelate epimerase [Campylobacter sp. RM5004]ULO00802.1 diaminopimelate epimerase [Campylobacter sp. RM5004]
MEFHKYYANGNDFIIFKSDNLDSKYLSNLAKNLCNRYSGIGADGLIAIKKEENKEYDFSWGFYNQDGSSASMCGNGARAAAHFAYSNNLAKEKMSFLTGAGIIKANIYNDDFVEIRLTKAKIIHENLVEFGNVFCLIDTGVPHLVTLDGVQNYNEENAKYLREKYDANVNYSTFKDGVLYVRTYERGVGETLACGTGMNACFYYARMLKLVDEKATIYPKSNDICEVSFKDDYLYFKAQVKKIFITTLDC